jgi:acetyl-CoA carboxylase biotin carboxyl carrier protein
MDISYIKKLIKLLDESGIDEIEIEEEGKKVRVSKTHHNSSIPTAFIPQYVSQPLNTPTLVPQPAVSTKEDLQPSRESIENSKAEGKRLHEVRSPIVGTFYRAPAPNADPYVQVGSMVQQGTVLCIIEAMKLMNEIESDVAGKVVQILVENAQAVEYNQPLFLIEPI